MKNLLFILTILTLFGCTKESDDTNQNPNEQNDPTEQSSPLYLDENGVTIKARDWVPVPSVAELNGIEYLVVSEAMLRDMVNNGEDVRKVVTTKVTDMSDLFRNKYFNQLIDHWDVSNVTNMSRMFWSSNDDIPTYDHPIGDWDVSNVTNMFEMFRERKFNQDISGWDVSKVTNMSNMFYGSSFNQPIGDWDVSSVIDMSRMFGDARWFNQDLSSWDVSNVTDMSGMFSGSQFNQDISTWNVNNVTDMSTMFGGTNFNYDISSWIVSNVTDMSGMFSGSQFNQDIGSWDVSNVTNMSSMFSSNEIFNQDLSDWNVSNVIDCSNFNSQASQWTLPRPNFTNCPFVDFVDASGPAITTMTITLVPQGGGTNITFQSRDLDGSGPNPPVITVSGDLAGNTDYSASIVLLNETESPAENITEIIEQESDQYQFFFVIDGGLNATTTYTNFDGNGNPIGTEFVLATGAAGTGDFSATLRHQPKKPNDGTLADAGGETEITQTFSLTIN